MKVALIILSLWALAYGKPQSGKYLFGTGMKYSFTWAMPYNYKSLERGTHSHDCEYPALRIKVSIIEEEEAVLKGYLKECPRRDN